MPQGYVGIEVGIEQALQRREEDHVSSTRKKRKKCLVWLGITWCLMVATLTPVTIIVVQKQQSVDSDSNAVASDQDFVLSPTPQDIPSSSPMDFLVPTHRPSASPLSIGEKPTKTTNLPTTAVSVDPSSFPSLASNSFAPSSPLRTSPSTWPSPLPSGVPSKLPSSSLQIPSSLPSIKPSSAPSHEILPINVFAVADAPYTRLQGVKLQEQMSGIDANADFVLHLGDIRAGRGDGNCSLSEYQSVANILSHSPVPVFIVLGDNEFNDCPAPEEALGFWRQTFVGFEHKHWDCRTAVQRMDDRSESFSFMYGGVLFIGLNIVGGIVHDVAEWSHRLSSQADWAKQLIRKYQTTTVILGHAVPRRPAHDDFFVTMQAFIRDELKNSLPIWYVGGDRHSWHLEPNFFGQPSWTRITLSGLTLEPPLHLFTSPVQPRKGFPLLEFDRQMS